MSESAVPVAAAGPRDDLQFRLPSLRDRIFLQFVRLVVMIYYTLYHRLSVEGRKNIPKTGPVVIACNHASHLDPPVIGGFCPRYMHYMAKIELFTNGLWGKILRAVGAFPIRRGAADRAAIRYSRDVLSAGEVLLLFPEGTRSRDGKRQPAQTGIGMILSNFPQVPIVPVHIQGSFDCWKPGRKYPLPRKIRVVVGKPFTLEEVKPQGEVKKQLYQEIGEEIMTRIYNASAAS